MTRILAAATVAALAGVLAPVVCLGAEPAAPAAEARKAPVVVWPTLTPAGDAPGETPLHKPKPTEGHVYERAQDLDATLRDAVQDLGFTLYVADGGPAPGRTRDEDVLERAAQAPSGKPAEPGSAGTWVVSPRLESAGGGDYVVRLVAVAPSGHELRVRVETVAGDLVPVRGLVMLRDLLTPQAEAAAALETSLRGEARSGAARGEVGPVRSEGRAVLAVNLGLFGAFTALSLEEATSSTDPRVLYPLLAVGTGIGIGAALLTADEWDVTTGDAWYVSAGAFWGTTAGLLIATGQNVQPTGDRYSWGMGGGLLGIGLATVALSRTSMDEGDAALAHSGGGLGLALGAAIEDLGKGKTTDMPYGGMGYGAAIGLVGAGLLAAQVTASPSRVLLVDLGAGGGALLGAAAASPLLISGGPDNTRGWLSATLGGAVLGGGLAWWLTRDVASPHLAWRWGTPSAGVIGTSATRTGAEPVYGIGWSGGF